MSAGAGRRIAVPDGIDWRRMHPVSPLLEGWKIVTAFIAIIAVRNVDNLADAYRYATAHGFDLAHGVVRWALLGGLAVIVVVVSFLFLQWWAKTYAVDRDGVYLRSGIVIRQLRVARLPRIQAVDVVHPLLGRIFGLGMLTVEVAGGSDSRVVIGYLSTARLEALRDLILDLAAGDAEDPARTADSSARAVSTAAPGSAGSSGSSGPAGPAALGAPNPTDPAASGSAGPAAPGPPSEVRRVSGSAPLGFEGAVDAAPLRSAGKREEHPLYIVGPGILIGSILRSAMTLWAAVLVIVVVIGVVMAVIGDDGAGLGVLLPGIAGPIAIVGAVWNRFNRGWGFQAAATPAGIRMRFGFTSEISSTLPPGRVHAVSIEQGLLWRREDWWRVRVGVAGREGSRSSDSSSSRTSEERTGDVLLPVGRRDTALRALWLVVPDLGVPDPGGFLAAALSGADDDGAGRREAPAGSPSRGFIRISPRGRIFSPLAWRREAIALTDTCVVLRFGRWTRRVSVVPYERIQSTRVLQGPFARSRGLATIHLDMVGRAVGTSLSNLDIADAAAIQRVVSERAPRRRRAERLDRWLARAADDGSAAPTGTA